MFQNFLARLQPKKLNEEEESDSLLARAFQAPAKGKAENSLTNQLALLNVPVARYTDPYAGLQRSVLRILLTIVLPVLGVALMVYLITTSVSSMVKPSQINAESVTLGNVPLPSGVTPLGSAFDSSYYKNIAETWMRGYKVRVNKIESYTINSSPNELIQYYKKKLVDSKTWQIQKQLGLSSSMDTLYVRKLNNTQVEGLYLQIRVRLDQDLKQVVSTTGDGTGFVLAKLIAEP